MCLHIIIFYYYSLCGAILFGAHQCHLPPSVWQYSLVGFRLLTSVFNVWQRSRTHNLQSVFENSGPILTRLLTKVHKILKRCIGDLSYLPTPLDDCLRHVSLRRHSPLSLEVVAKPNKFKSFWPQFLGRNDRDFSAADYSAIYCPPFGKVWLIEFRLLVSVCEAWQWSRKQNLRKVRKMAVQFEAVCGPKFTTFWHDIRDKL